MGSAHNMCGVPQLIVLSQRSVTHSRHMIKMPLGTLSISKKKISDESSKKTDKSGPKKKLPANVSKEMGIPHETKMGNEMRVI